MEEQVLCFKHCGSIIFSFGLPEICPLCKNSMLTSPPDDIPFRLPYPFVRAQQHPCSIVIKSTSGTFLDNYSINKDLHIGITDSKGKVYEFDSRGLQKGNTEEWTQSIVVFKISEVWRNHWDSILALMSTNQEWKSDNYDETKFNCFSFVIRFLELLNCSELNEFIDKEKFCQKFIFSKIVSTNEYLKIHRSVKKNGYYIEHSK